MQILYGEKKQLQVSTNFQICNLHVLQSACISLQYMQKIWKLFRFSRFSFYAVQLLSNRNCWQTVLFPIKL